MKIKFINNKRFLINTNNEEINTNDNDIVEYIGIYYKTIDNLYDMEEIEKKFIGKIETDRSDETGITGLYIQPLFIYENNEWLRIVNYSFPKTKYFLYPHLLMKNGCYYNYKPIYKIDSIKNINIEDFKLITKTFLL